MKTRYVFTLIISVLFAGMAVAQENGSGWSVSAGASFRQLKANFKSSAPPALDWSNVILVNHDNGSRELYKGDGVPVVYGNGTVGIYDFNDGSCTFMAASPDQVGINPNASSMYRNPVRAINFQSDIYTYSADVSQTGLDASDDETTAHPYLSLRYKGPAMMGGNIGFLCQYAFMQGDFASGNRTTASTTVKQHHEQYAISYDVDEFYVARSDIAAEIPGANPAFGVDGVVWDATLYNAEAQNGYGRENAQAPRVASVTHVNEWAQFDAITKNKVSVDLHELVLAPEWRLQSKPFSCGIAVGPTINLVSSDFDSATQWVRHDTGAVVASGPMASESDQKVKVGAMVGVSFACFIDKRCLYFVEVAGSYHWLDKQDIGKGADRVELDASSLEGSIGIGVRL